MADNKTVDEEFGGEICFDGMIRMRVMKWIRKLTEWCITKRTVCDCWGGRCGYSIERDWWNGGAAHWLNKDHVLQIEWFRGLCMWKDRWDCHWPQAANIDVVITAMWQKIAPFTATRAREFWICWDRCSRIFIKVVIKDKVNLTSSSSGWYQPGDWGVVNVGKLLFESTIEKFFGVKRSAVTQEEICHKTFLQVCDVKPMLAGNKVGYRLLHAGVRSEREKNRERRKQEHSSIVFSFSITVLFPSYDAIRTAACNIFGTVG